MDNSVIDLLTIRPFPPNHLLNKYNSAKLLIKGAVVNNFGEIVGLGVVVLPIILVWIVGIVLSVTHWQKSPKKARLSLIAFIVFLLVLYVQIRFNLLTLSLVTQQGTTVGIIPIILGMVGFVFATIAAGLWSLLALSSQGEMVK